MATRFRHSGEFFPCYFFLAFGFGCFAGAACFFSATGFGAGAFAALTGDTFYAHMSDDEAARNPLFGSRVAHGYFLIAAAAGLFVDPPYGPVLGNYGLDSLRFVKPVKPGDRIRVRLTCKQKSLRADKGWGEVRWDTEITNQNGETVASYEVLTMVSVHAVPDRAGGDS